MLRQGVEWAPEVFEAAETHGLVLLEEEGVWDTSLRPTPPNARRVLSMSRDAAAAFDVYDSAQLEGRVFRAAARAAPLPPDHPLSEGLCGQAKATVVIGLCEGAPLPGGDGFELLRLSASAAGAGRRPCARPEKEVIICHVRRTAPLTFSAVLLARRAVFLQLGRS